MEVKAYEQQIYNLQSRLLTSKTIVQEQQEKMKNAKKELLVLWKMEITSVVSKKKEGIELALPGIRARKEAREEKPDFEKRNRA